MKEKKYSSCWRPLALLLALLSGMFSGGCCPYHKEGIDGRYDSSHNYVDGIDRVLEKAVGNIYRIETSTRFRVGEDTSTLKVVGIAFSINDRHLLTANHVTSIDGYQVQTNFGVMVFSIPPEDKVEETTSIVFDDGSRAPVRVILRDELLDFALLEAGFKVNPPFYPMGNSDDFRIANEVILPSNFQRGLNIRLGYVTQLHFIRYGPNGEIAEKNENIFGISTVVNEGESGSPILFLRDGKVELGGIVSFIVLPARGLGYGVKIGPILERLRMEVQYKGLIPPPPYRP